MKSKWYLLCWLALMGLTFTTAFADDNAKKSPDDIDKMILSEIKERQEIMPNLTYISDVIGPRMTGSANLKRANEWAMEKFKSYGLENVRLEPYTIPTGLERGFARMKMV